MQENRNVSDANSMPLGFKCLNYCTYFDKNYLARGLALYESLLEHSPGSFVLWILCLDNETFITLTKLNLSSVILIRFEDFESFDTDLVNVKPERSLVEYYWSCTPSLLLFIFNRHPEVDMMTYLDGDLFFFSDPSPIYAELGEKSVMMIGHRFPSELEHLDIYGKYNVGLMVFRRNSAGLHVLNWWRARCIEWCFDYLDGSRYGDQKYLDQFEKISSEVVILQHPGAGLAPWNLAGYDVSHSSSGLLINQNPLVFYHFHGMKFVNGVAFTHRLYSVFRVTSPPSFQIVLYLYLPYIRQLLEIDSRLRPLGFKMNLSEVSFTRQELLHYLSLGHCYLFVGPALWVRLLAWYGFLRYQADELAKQGYLLVNKKDQKWLGRQKLLIASLLAPRMWLDRRFWQSLLFQSNKGY